MAEPQAQPKQYVRTDEHGVMRVGDTRVMLDSVVYAFEQGESPDSIRRAYPSLSLEQVYGAITYYLAHRDEVREYLKRQEGLWAELRAKTEAESPELYAKLRAARERLANRP
jgi:uncharacterized protein (DUF433 family)